MDTPAGFNDLLTTIGIVILALAIVGGGAIASGMWIAGKVFKKK